MQLPYLDPSITSCICLEFFPSFHGCSPTTPLNSLGPDPCRLSVHIAVQFQDYNIGFIVMKDGTAYLRNDPTTLRGQVGSEIRWEGRLMRE